MRSFDPNDSYDVKALAKLKVEPWMVEMLKLNRGYVHWGPGEDYQRTQGESWSTSLELDSWEAFGPWVLDELNEVVNFYFELDRFEQKCAYCDGSGYNPATNEIADTFYDHGDWRVDFTTMTMRGNIENARKPGGATGRRWHDKITQDEVDALVEHGRLREFDATKREWKTVPRTAEEVNAANRAGGIAAHALAHDGINRGILIETRAKRLGVYGMCDWCNGDGSIFTEPQGHLNVVLWFIHPRKGCSRGVRVKRLSREEAKQAVAYLVEARDRNAVRFSALAGFDMTREVP